MPEEIQPEQQSKSTRSYEDWKKSLMKIVTASNAQSTTKVDDDMLKPYYDQGLMPTVAFNQLFNQ